jgi:hypothetical protein
VSIANQRVRYCRVAARKWWHRHGKRYIDCHCNKLTTRSYLQSNLQLHGTIFFGGVSIKGFGSSLLYISYRQLKRHIRSTTPCSDTQPRPFSSSPQRSTPAAVYGLGALLRLLQKPSACLQKLVHYQTTNGVTALCDLEVSAQDASLVALEQKIYKRPPLRSQHRVPFYFRTHRSALRERDLVARLGVRAAGLLLRSLRTFWRAS